MPWEPAERVSPASFGSIINAAYLAFAGTVKAALTRVKVPVVRLEVVKLKLPTFAQVEL